MKIGPKEKYLLLKTVQEKQILPLTSVCSLNCIFCSHKQNPPGINIYRFGHLPTKLVRELIGYLPQKGVVTIGESATKIVEGEPLLHPDFKEIMSFLRRECPEKEIRITTAGSQLDHKLVDFLSQLKPLELNISLNCSTPRKRKEVMHDPRPETIFLALEYLEKKGLTYHGSIVAWPGILKDNQLEKTVTLLEERGASTVRVFMPGFTDYSPSDFKFATRKYEHKLEQKVFQLQEQKNIPVIKEPPLLKDFTARIQGIISETPAAKCGLKNADIIKKVEGKKILTRVDKFNTLVQCQNPGLTIQRNGQTFKTVMKKESGQKPGLILHSDFPGQLVEQLKRIIKISPEKKIGIITSVLAEKLIEKLLMVIADSFVDKNFREDITLIPVKNRFFGGNIRVAGLLTTRDIIQTLNSPEINVPDLLVVPEKIYGLSGKDLCGASYTEISKKMKIDIELI
ncbi:MAG: DUF512 domain-containing protein [Bacillota bacterium]